MATILLRIESPNRQFRIKTSKTSTVIQLKAEIAQYLKIDPVSHTVSIKGKEALDDTSICGNTFKRGQKLIYTFEAPVKTTPLLPGKTVTVPVITTPGINSTKKTKVPPETGHSLFNFCMHGYKDTDFNNGSQTEIPIVGRRMQLDEVAQLKKKISDDILQGYMKHQPKMPGLSHGYHAGKVAKSEVQDATSASPAEPLPITMHVHQFQTFSNSDDDDSSDYE